MNASALAFFLVIGLVAGGPAENGIRTDDGPPSALAETPKPAGDEPQLGAEETEIVPPSLLEQPALVHPLSDADARALGPARVVVLVTVDVDGGVSDAAVLEEASHPDARLRGAALDAAKAARFQPATRAGKALTVRLPFALTFEPPVAPPVVDGVGASAPAFTPAGEELDADAPFDTVALAHSLVVGGALVLGASLLFTTFSGVTALDDASRQEELAKTDAEVAAANKTRTFGTTLLLPLAGPFLALPSTPDASTALFTSLGGTAQVAGVALIVTGASLWAWPLVAGGSGSPGAPE